MASVDFAKLLGLVPALLRAPRGYIWSSYDEGADVLYINFKKPSHATESELTDEDAIIRYEGREVVGLTVLHASRRKEAPRGLSEREGQYKTGRKSAARTRTASK